MWMPSNRWMITCCSVALLSTGCMTHSKPAQAQRITVGGIGISIGGMFGGVRTQRSSRSRTARSSRSRSSSEGSSSDNSDAPLRNERKDKVLASKGAPSSKDQTAILRFVAASEVLGAVGSTKDLEQVGQARSKELDRDYTGKIKKIIERFKSEQQSQRNTRPGDVTEHAIEESLEKAFASAKLDTFEKFVGENWSTERLRVMVLDLVNAELGRLFDGNNRGNAPMLALDSLIQRSAQSAYRRIFETSELLAANQSAALFMQRLYQTHGSLLDDQTRESADGMITQASSQVVAKFAPLLRQDENVFALRYRAQRIVLDCLSAHIEEISSSHTAMRSIAEIGQQVTMTSDKTCAQWLDYQFVAEGPRRDNQIAAEGTRNQFDRAKLKPQQPVPMRAVWAADGPTFDQSIIARPGGAF